MNDNLNMTRDEALNRILELGAKGSNIAKIIENLQERALKNKKASRDILAQMDAKDENEECDTYGMMYKSNEKMYGYLACYRMIAKLQEESKALGDEAEKIAKQYDIKTVDATKISEEERTRLYGERYSLLQTELNSSALKNDRYEESYDDIKSPAMASNIISNSSKTINTFMDRLTEIEKNDSWENLPSVAEFNDAVDALRSRAAAFRKNTMYNGMKKGFTRFSFFKKYLRKKIEGDTVKKIISVDGKEYPVDPSKKRKGLFRVAEAIMEHKLNKAEENAVKVNLEPIDIANENKKDEIDDDFDAEAIMNASLQNIPDPQLKGEGLGEMAKALEDKEKEAASSNPMNEVSNNEVSLADEVYFMAPEAVANLSHDAKISADNKDVSQEIENASSLKSENSNAMSYSRFKEIEKMMIDERRLDEPLTFGINNDGNFDEKLYNQEYDEMFVHAIADALPNLVMRGKISPVENAQFIRYAKARYEDARNGKLSSINKPLTENADVKNPNIFGENNADKALDENDNIEVSDRAKEILENALNNPEIRDETKDMVRKNMNEMSNENKSEIKDETKKDVENGPLENSSSDSLDSVKKDSGDKYYNELSDSRNRYEELKSQKNQMFNEWKKEQLDEYFEKNVKPTLGSREDYEANMERLGLTESYDEYVARAKANINEAEAIEPTEFKLPQEFEWELNSAKASVDVNNQIYRNQENKQREENIRKDRIRRANVINEINQNGLNAQKIARVREAIEKHYGDRDENSRDTFTDEELLSKYDEFVENGIISEIPVKNENVQSKSR